MINEIYAKRYCCEDISKIENYEQAVNDTTQVWDIHHRVEILPCGAFSRKDLEEHNLLYKQPAERLIFLTHEEHRRLHCMNLSDETRAKMSAAQSGEKNPMFGKRHSEESRAKMSASLMGNTNFLGHHHTEETREKIGKSVGAAHKGMHWFNNGEKCVLAKECPQGFIPGRLRSK